jgi:hypothetical protein
MHMKKLNKKERVVNVHWCQKCSHFAHYFLTCKHQKLAMLVFIRFVHIFDHVV